MSEDKAQDEQELLSDSGSDESGEEEGSEEEVRPRMPLRRGSYDRRPARALQWCAARALCTVGVITSPRSAGWLLDHLVLQPQGQ